MRRLIPPSAVIIITLLGALFRFHDLAQPPLRGDEAFAVLYWARQPLSLSLTQTATIEPHPALTYALFHGWGLTAGTSAFSMRLLPALVNLLGIPAIYVLGVRLAPADRNDGRMQQRPVAIGWEQRATGLLAALLFALHPFEIWHAQDARNNAIWAGLSVVSLCVGVLALEKPSRRRWALYSLCAALTANVFYLELLFLGAFGAYVFAGQRKQFRTWALAVAPAFITSGASFVILQGALIASGSYAGTIASRFDLNLLLRSFLPALSFGETLPVEVSGALWPFIVAALAGGVIARRRLTSARKLFLPLMLLLPIIVFSGAAARFNIFTPRYLLPLAPIIILIFSSLCVEMLRRGWTVSCSRGRAVSLMLGGAALLIGWLVVAGNALHNYYAVSAYAKSRDWPALTEYLAASVSADDLVIQLSVDSAFGYYYDAAADDIALPGYPTQPIDEIHAILEREAARRQSIWIVGQTFADWPSAGIVETWLETHMQTGRAGMAADLNYRQFVPWNVSSGEIGDTLATFGEIADLVGYQVYMPPVPSGDLTVWLYWQPVSISAKPLKVFVHLVGTVNPQTGTPLWSQDDQLPQDGRANTDSWQSGHIYRDIYTLPLADVPSGDYTLNVGFYEPDSGKRLPVGAGDSYALSSITLAAR